MKLAVLMDPVADLIAYKDTTVAMLKRAMDFGWRCVFFTKNDLCCRDGKAYAQTYSIKIGEVAKPGWAEVTSLGEQPLSDFNIILMRQDPPFDLEYIYATYALELAEKEGVLVVNKPQSLRDHNEKFFTLNFPQCCPPTLVTNNIKQLQGFWQQHQQVIFKPLAAMGGNSVFYVNETGHNLAVILEVLTKNQKTTIMAQKFISDLTSTGDKRIILINGEPVDYAVARIPAPGEFRGNLAAGGHGEVVPLNARDRWVCAQISATLKDQGLYFVGIDVIGDYLTEINVTSPTCLCDLEAASALDLSGHFLNILANLVALRHS